MIRQTARDHVRQERALTRAAQAWLAGRPHESLLILKGAGMDHLWPEFHRVALRRARARFLARMSG